MNAERETILNALDHWTRQRPGLEFCNYGDVPAYRSELRSITRDLHDFRVLARAVELSGITAEQLREGFRAYSGRLTWDGSKLDYCTGQYWPTEYRKAACAVLAAALWDYHREHCMPAAIVQNGEKNYPHCNGSANTISGGEWLRTNFRRLFGRGIAGRWFN